MHYHIAAVLLAAAGTTQTAQAIQVALPPAALSTLTVEQTLAPFSSSSTQTVALSMAQFNSSLGNLVGITFRTQIDSYSAS